MGRKWEMAARLRAGICCFRRWDERMSRGAEPKQREDDVRWVKSGVVYTPGNEILSCCPLPPRQHHTAQQSLKRVPQVFSNITSCTFNPASQMSSLTSQVWSGITDVFVVNLAQLYLLPVKVTRNTCLHLVSQWFGLNFKGCTSDSAQGKQQISETSISSAISEAKLEPFLSRAAHLLQSSQVPQTHFFLKWAGWNPQSLRPSTVSILPLR